MERVNVGLEEEQYEEVERRIEDDEADSQAEAVRQMIDEEDIVEEVVEEVTIQNTIEDFFNEDQLDMLQHVIDTGQADDLQEAAAYLIEWGYSHKYRR